MKNICLIIVVIFNNLLSFGQKECVKVTMLNPIDTVYRTEGSRHTLFLIESLGDTIIILRVNCGCGCEIPLYHPGKKIYPGEPDTVDVTTTIRDRTGLNNHETTIITSKCEVLVSTHFFISDETITPLLKLVSFRKYNSEHPKYKDEMNYEIVFQVDDNTNLDAKKLESNIVVENWSCEKIGSDYFKIFINGSGEWLKKDEKLSISLIFNRNVLFKWEEE